MPLVHIYTYILVCMCIYTHTHTYIQVCMCVYIYTCVCVCVCVCVCLCVCVCVCVRTHARIYIHSYTPIYLCIYEIIGRVRHKYLTQPPLQYIYSLHLASLLDLLSLLFHTYVTQLFPTIQKKKIPLRSSPKKNKKKTYP